MDIINETELFFAEAIKKKLLKFEVSDGHGHTQLVTDQRWLAVYFHEDKDFDPDDHTVPVKWKLVCAQSLHNYYTADGNPDVLKLVNRITLMLAECLRSAQQDINGLTKQIR